ncbi:hypothetical protein Esti_005899 [Eimeria stiedai]
MSLAVQAQIRRNAEEVRAYLEDLRSWERSLNDKRENKEAEGRRAPCEPKSQPTEPKSLPQQHDEQKSKEKTGVAPRKVELNRSPELNPLASKATKLDSANKKKKYARDLNSLPDYYKAWDAFDPDAEEPTETKQASKTPQSENPAHLKEPSRVARGNRHGSQATAKVQHGSRMRIRSSATPISFDQTGQQPTLLQEGNVLEELRASKNRGNAAFAAGRYRAAVESYTEALKVAEDSGKQSASTWAELTGQIYGNRAAAHYRLKKYDKCISDCTEALQRNPKNLKVLYRRGLAWAGNGDTEKAIQDLQHALQSLNQEEGSHSAQKLPPHDASTSWESAKIEQKNDQALATSFSAANTGSPDCHASGKSCLKEKIEQDLSRIRNEVEGKKREERQARKAALLQPLRDSDCRFSGETLRPLEVKVIQQMSTEDFQTQKTPPVPFKRPMELNVAEPFAQEQAQQ